MTCKFDKNFLRRWLLQRKVFNAIRRASADTRGVTAIEFGILIFPFLMLLFAIMESALQLFVTSALDTAVRKESRALQLGAAQISQISASQFKQSICRQVPMPNACDNLTIDVRTVSNWYDITTRFNNSSESDRRLSAIGGSPQFCLATDNQIVLVRAFLKLPVISGFWLAGGPDATADTTGVTANHLFRVEPFGAASTQACL